MRNNIDVVLLALSHDFVRSQSVICLILKDKETRRPNLSLNFDFLRCR